MQQSRLEPGCTDRRSPDFRICAVNTLLSYSKYDDPCNDAFAGTYRQSYLAGHHKPTEAALQMTQHAWYKTKGEEE